MSTIVPSNTTTQLLIKNEGVEDIYTSLKLTSDQVVMNNIFYEDESLSDIIPKIFTIKCPSIQPDTYGFCTWEIKNDSENGIFITNKSVILNVKDSSGTEVKVGSQLVSYIGSSDTTYALNIYIKSQNVIPNETYSAVIQL